jgi:hypothetical protein
MMILLLLLQIARSGAMTAPPLPYVDQGACPFECCVYRDWTAEKQFTAVKHHDAPGNKERSFIVKRGERVTAMSGIVITTAAGVVRVTKPVTLEVYSKRFPKAPVEKLALAPDARLYLLTPQGEGWMSGWADGRLLESFDAASFADASVCEKSSRCDGIVQKQAAREWWVKVRNSRGQFGWILMPRSYPTFSGTDACG